jgi:hypothetical protein
MGRAWRSADAVAAILCTARRSWRHSTVAKRYDFFLYFSNTENFWIHFFLSSSAVVQSSNTHVRGATGETSRRHVRQTTTDTHRIFAKRCFKKAIAATVIVIVVLHCVFAARAIRKRHHSRHQGTRCAVLDQSTTRTPSQRR